MNAQPTLRVLALLLASLMAVELAGHAIDALGFWHDPLRPSRRVPEEGVLLVVGDGAAWGVGVPRARAWPWRLAAADASTHLRCAPRLHTADAARQLPQWLAETSPAVVLLSLGIDDAHVTPAPWTEREWTLLRGLRTRGGLGLLSAPRAEHDPRLLVGRWRSSRVELQLRADGSAALGERHGTWRARGGLLWLTTADRSTARLDWRRDRDTLLLAGEALGGALEFEAGARPAAPLARAQDALDRGQLLEARTRAKRLRASGAAASVVAPLLASVDAVEGSGDAALPHAYRAPPEFEPARIGAFEELLGLCVRTCQRAGARVVVLGHAGATEPLDAAAERCAQAAGAAYLAAPKLSDGDALYLDPAGHAALAAALQDIRNTR